MEAITQYKAKDGSIHPTESAALKRDNLVDRVAAAMRALGKPHEFVEDGKGWFQHDLETVLLAKDAILDICREEGYGKDRPVFQHKGRECNSHGIIGRILSDNS